MSTKKILLVEDNVDDERITLRALRRINVTNEVVVACDGAKAFSILERDIDTTPNLVILDLHLQDISGFDILNWIRAHNVYAHVPVVVFSSSQSLEERKRCYELGANSYVRKPDDHHAFEDAVLQMSMYWLLLNEAHAQPIPA